MATAIIASAIAGQNVGTMVSGPHDAASAETRVALAWPDGGWMLNRSVEVSTGYTGNFSFYANVRIDGRVACADEARFATTVMLNRTLEPWEGLDLSHSRLNFSIPRGIYPAGWPSDGGWASTATQGNVSVTADLDRTRPRDMVLGFTAASTLQTVGANACAFADSVPELPPVRSNDLLLRIFFQYARERLDGTDSTTVGLDWYVVFLMAAGLAMVRRRTERH